MRAVLTGKRRGVRPVDRGKLVGLLTVTVVLLQVGLLVTFALDPSEPPRQSSLLQALWALSHKPSFYPLVLLLGVGPVATWLSFSVAGRHRWLLLGSWAVFMPLLIAWHGHRVWVMLQLLWRHGGG